MKTALKINNNKSHNRKLLKKLIQEHQSLVNFYKENKEPRIH